MGITLPKLPKIHLPTHDAKSFASELADAYLKPRIKKQPIGIVPPPEWVEKIDGYVVSSCKWHDSGRFGGCFVVEYAPNDRSVSRYWDGVFVKIYAADSMNEPPFVQMKGIWKEIYEDKRKHIISYGITEDGRIYSDLGEFPSDEDIRNAIHDIGGMYNDWKDFPNVQDWFTVCRLVGAKMAVDHMRVEEKYGHEQKNIDNLRKKITEIQTQIAEAEKNLNEMYENAADGMNLLEEHGVKIDMEKGLEPEEKFTSEELSETVDDIIKDLSLDCDNSGLYPNSILKYIGEAAIMRMYDGSYVVTPKPLNHHPKAGDLVHDTGNGLTAVYTSYGKWEVVNP